MKPDQAEHRWQDHSRNVIDRETDGGGAGYVFGSSDFLEVGFDGDGQSEEKVINDIERAGHYWVICESVGCEYNDQTNILNRQCSALANDTDQLPNFCREEKVEQIVSQIEQ